MSSFPLATAKTELRSKHQQARQLAAHDRDTWRKSNAALGQNVAEFLKSLRFPGQPLRVAGYVPLDDEPGAGTLLNALESHTDELWLPICQPGFRLSWSQYDGPDSLAVRNPRLPIPEPRGEGISSTECLPTLDLIVLPALAIDYTGYRLGKGAGFYDRAIAEAWTACSSNTSSSVVASAKAMPELVGVVFSTEVCPFVPHDERDCAVNRIITEIGITTIS